MDRLPTYLGTPRLGGGGSDALRCRGRSLRAACATPTAALPHARPPLDRRYGDIVAVTVPEAAVAACAMLLAIFIFSFMVNVIGDLLTVSSLSAMRGQQIREELQGIEAWGKASGGVGGRVLGQGPSGRTFGSCRHAAAAASRPGAHTTGTALHSKPLPPVLIEPHPHASMPRNGIWALR